MDTDNDGQFDVNEFVTAIVKVYHDELLNEDGSTHVAVGGWVDVGSYKRLDVEVVGGPGGDTTYACRTYEVVNKDLSGLLPSPAYKGVICFGAGEVGLPDDYRAGLQAVAVNDFEGPYKVGYDKWVWYASNEYQKV
jgi:hypothetical protein